jgi:predicted N-formylglutamate amidohydrolase
MQTLDIGLVLSCEHASCAVPPGVDLGVPEALLRSHVGWDPGALKIAALLAGRWGVPLHAGRATRLFVDLNRSEANPAVVPLVAFSAEVPGNRLLAEAERLERVRLHHRPYRQAVLAEVRRVLEAQDRCLHLPIHSFTPELNGQRRPYELGLLFDPARPFEAAVAGRLSELLRAEGFEVRLNEPYAGTEDGIATWLRTLFPDAAYAGVEIETSHAVTEAAGGIERVGEALARLVPRALAG